MKNNEIIQSKNFLLEEKGYSNYIDGGETDGSQDDLETILRNIAAGGDEDINEETRPNIVFSIYEHIIEKLRPGAEQAGLRMSIFEETYPTASSFYEDIQQILR